MAYMVKRGTAYDTDMMRNFDAMVNRVFGSAGVNLSPTPSVDIRDEKERYIVEFELPGFTQSDVDITVKDNVLSVSSVPVSDEEKEEVSDRRRRRAFSRRFSLPRDVNKDAIEAAFTNGLLIVTLNKQPEAQPRKIEIQAN